MTTVTLPMSIAWVATPSPLSAKKSMYAKITSADDDERQPQRGRDDPLRRVDPGGAGLLAVRGLVHPPVVGRLLGRTTAGRPP